MTIQHIQQPWGNPASYSQSASTDGLIFTCGQLGVDAGAGDVPFELQAETALRRLVEVVEAAGGSIETIVKVNGFLADLADFPAYDRIYREILAVSPMPARTTVQIAAFPAPILVEVDAVAARLTAPEARDDHGRRQAES